MPVALAEVPAHVQLQTQTRNYVSVQGGTNWDLSRSAVATPIAQLADPAPVRIESPVSALEVAAAKPANATVEFRNNSSVVPRSGLKALQPVLEHKQLLVTGHASDKETRPVELSLKRAESVARYLRSKGAKVEVRASGSEFVGEPARRVEVRSIN